MSLSRLAAGALLSSFLIPAGAHAQARLTGADLSGAVRDESGGALPGVSITVTNVETNVKRTATTDTRGTYRVAALPPGTYRLTGRVAPGHVAGSVACGGPPGLPRLGYGDMGAGGQVLRVTACDRLEFGLWLRPGSDEVELDAVSLEKVD